MPEFPPIFLDGMQEQAVGSPAVHEPNNHCALADRGGTAMTRVAVESMPALIFDLDGTLIDTVYADVFAWQRALAEADLPIDGWRIHRRIGISGGLFTRAVARELGRPLTATEAEAIQARHGQLSQALLPRCRSGRRSATRTARATGCASGSSSAT